MSDTVLDALPPARRASRLAMGNIIIDPAALFDVEARTPNAWLPFMVLMGIMMLEVLGLSGFMTTVALNAMPESLRTAAGPEIAAMVQRNRWLGVVFVPVLQAVRVLGLGTLLFAAVVLVRGGDLDYEGAAFHRALTVVVYASFALALEEAVNLTSLYLIGAENVRYFWDLRPFPGLHYLLTDPGAHRMAFNVLQRLNPFTAYYGFLLAYGMRRMYGLRWPAASVIATMLVAVGTGCIALMSLLHP